jgi:hypothetical protein
VWRRNSNNFERSDAIDVRYKAMRRNEMLKWTMAIGWQWRLVTYVLHHQQPTCLNTVEEACVIIRLDFQEASGCLPVSLCDSRPKLTLMKSVTEDGRGESNTFLPVVSNLACPDFTQLLLRTALLGAFTKVEKMSLVSSCLSVRPQGISQLPSNGFLWNMLYDHFSKNLWEISWVWLTLYGA